MKKRLDQYTMAQFIDIACGDYSCIEAGGEDVKSVAESLIGQYNDVTDPTSAKVRLLEGKKIAQNKGRTILLRILLNLINVYGAYDEVREILAIIGVVGGMDDETVKENVEQMLRSEESLTERMRRELDKDKMEEVPEDEIRSSFDRQTAMLMAHFKFAISHETITASVYANLVDMACKQQRQQQLKK